QPSGRSAANPFVNIHHPHGGGLRCDIWLTDCFWLSVSQHTADAYLLAGTNQGQRLYSSDDSYRTVFGRFAYRFFRRSFCPHRRGPIWFHIDTTLGNTAASLLVSCVFLRDVLKKFSYISQCYQVIIQGARDEKVMGWRFMAQGFPFREPVVPVYWDKHRCVCRAWCAVIGFGARLYGRFVVG